MATAVASRNISDVLESQHMRNAHFKNDELIAYFAIKFERTYREIEDWGAFAEQKGYSDWEEMLCEYVHNEVANVHKKFRARPSLNEVFHPEVYKEKPTKIIVTFDNTVVHHEKVSDDEMNMFLKYCDEQKKLYKSDIMSHLELIEFFFKEMSLDGVYGTTVDRIEFVELVNS